MFGRLRARLTYANVVATLALVFAMAGGAYAASGGIGHGGVIHGCYARHGGQLRLVKAGTKCGRHQRAIAFDKTGPRGVAGPRGATGTPGPAGKVDTSSFYSKAQSDGRYVKGAGSVTAIPLTTTPNGKSVTLVTLPGLGQLTLTCALASTSFKFSNTSGVTENYSLSDAYTTSYSGGSHTPDTGTIGAGGARNTFIEPNDSVQFSVAGPRSATILFGNTEDSATDCQEFGDVYAS
jgi:hypothetical protein